MKKSHFLVGWYWGTPPPPLLWQNPQKNTMWFWFKKVGIGSDPPPLGGTKSQVKPKNFSTGSPKYTIEKYTLEKSKCASCWSPATCQQWQAWLCRFRKSPWKVTQSFRVTKHCKWLLFQKSQAAEGTNHLHEFLQNHDQSHPKFRLSTVCIFKGISATLTRWWA